MHHVGIKPSLWGGHSQTAHHAWNIVTNIILPNSKLKVGPVNDS